MLPPLIQAGKLLGVPEYIEAADTVLSYYRQQDALVPFNRLEHFHAYAMEALWELGEVELATRAMADVARCRRPKGTRIPDYMHVEDLCEAHCLALERLLDGDSSAAYNLGNGNGFSVQEVIDTATRIVVKPIQVKDGARRTGDPASLLADAKTAKQVMGWVRYPELESIIHHAWQWEQRQRRTNLNTNL
ncbi:MAG: hypothetical protein WA635_04710 [Gallionella sp.]